MPEPARKPARGHGRGLLAPKSNPSLVGCDGHHRSSARSDRNLSCMGPCFAPAHEQNGTDLLALTQKKCAWRECTTFSPASAEIRVKRGHAVLSKAVFFMHFFMHTDRPLTRWFKRAVPHEQPGLRPLLLVLLCAGSLLLFSGLTCATAFASPPPGAKAQTAPANSAAPAPSTASAPTPGTRRICRL